MGNMITKGSWRQSLVNSSNFAFGCEDDSSNTSDHIITICAATDSQHAENNGRQHAGYPPVHQYPAPQSYGGPPPPQLLPPLEEVANALARTGLESTNLIIGIDFTKSNEWTGQMSYNGRSLHHIGNCLNPYEQAISIIGKALAPLNHDTKIPFFGFGDAKTQDRDVFSFYPDHRFCSGFEEALGRYREILPNLKLAGPTSFAPIIEMAMTIVEQSGGQYHILLIIADGEVTRSVDMAIGQWSVQERKTIQAIVEASKFPLSIILVGVGDRPGDAMREFHGSIPPREFDNFQFVNFTEIMSKTTHQSQRETEFNRSVLMSIAFQYKAARELNLLGARNEDVSQHVALPPPTSGGSGLYNVPIDDAGPSAPNLNYDHQICLICLDNRKDVAFGCGHQTCCKCGEVLQSCPICRRSIEIRIKLY